MDHFAAAIESGWYRAVFALMSQFTYSTFDFFGNRGFRPALLPITCGAVSSPMGLGSDSLPVQVTLFDAPAFLADSMQFHLEYVLRQGDAGVFYLMSTFRGEDPDERHLNQFFHSEAELVGGLEDVMALVGDYVSACTRALLVECAPQIEEQAGTLDHLEHLVALRGRFPQISFQDAAKLLKGRREFFSERSPGVLTVSEAGERRLMEEFGGVVWLTHLPKRAVPFYQAEADDGEHSLCADLLLGIGEVVGCGERHRTAQATAAALREHRVHPAPYEWYLRMKRDYPLRSAGFGLGVERYLLWVLKHNDIRDIHLISRLKGIDATP